MLGPQAGSVYLTFLGRNADSENSVAGTGLPHNLPFSSPEADHEEGICMAVGADVVRFAPLPTFPGGACWVLPDSFPTNPPQL